MRPIRAVCRFCERAIDIAVLLNVDSRLGQAVSLGAIGWGRDGDAG